MRSLLRAFAFAVLLALAGGKGWDPDEEDPFTGSEDPSPEGAWRGTSTGSAAVREYVPGAWSTSFYRPHQIQIDGIGLINAETAYFSNRWGVSELYQGHLKHLKHLEVSDADITAFHLCHHRNSFFYEVTARGGGTVTIFEHSLLFENQVQVWQNEDASAATSLACVDKLLLRASSSNLLAIDVESAESSESDKKEHAAISVLFEYDPHDDANVITSLATGYAADVYTRAQVYALVPHNRTLLRLHLETDHQSEQVVAESEPLLSGGDGSDGALSAASMHDPLFVLSVHDTVLFADGCSLRQISDGHVRTLLGIPTECTAPHNETLAPVPWASRLSKPEALAGVAEETHDGTVLALTGSEVISIAQIEDECARHIDAEECSRQSGCGWAAGEKPGEQLCFGCDGLHVWAAAQAIEDACILEMAPQGGTRYNLVGCGCIAPPPEPESQTIGLTVLQILVGGSVIIAVFCCVLMYHRSSRRRADAMRELYGADTCEFTLFTDVTDEEP